MTIDGHADRRFWPVREALADVVATQNGPGAAVAAWTDGTWVLDLWGGDADAGGRRPWQRDSRRSRTRYPSRSPRSDLPPLADRGQLDLDVPVQRYWPEFTAPATVRHVLSHQAGVVALDQPAATATFYDWTRMCDLLAAQAPQWDPGRARRVRALLRPPGRRAGQADNGADARAVPARGGHGAARP